MNRFLLVCVTASALTAASFAQDEKKPPGKEKAPPQATIETTVTSAEILKPGDAGGASARITGKAVVTAESDLTASIHSLKFFLVDPAGKQIGRAHV